MLPEYNAFLIGGDWRRTCFRLSSSYIDLGEVHPEVGFVQRPDPANPIGFRRIRGDASYTPWPANLHSRDPD